jgi:DNA polymerase-3 subunit gamma/tau
MSYLALARKWRPAQFSQVVGQAHVLTALENALNQNKLHHAYLFSGTRGVGKTTIGRLFAKGLNCETGITATPCGQCDTCREIDEGRFVDLLEIDAASRTKVEDTRDLLDNVQYKPARGRFKVYLIDEVHMLSRHSFNALLKTLEEPPEYVKFLLATTDPQKLPVTILSRCLQFHLKPISVDTIHEQLNFILEKENVSVEQRALGMIAHAADGSMRDALSLADQAIALGNGAVASDTVATMLGTLDTDQALMLLDAIASKQAQVAMSAVAQLAQNGVEWDGLLKELATQLHRIAMYQALPASLDAASPDAEKLIHLSQKLDPQDLQLSYQIALKGRQDLPLAPTERMGLEMVVLRMIAFRPAHTASAGAIELPSQQPVSQSAAAASSLDSEKTAPQKQPQADVGAKPVAPAPEPNKTASQPMRPANPVASSAPQAAAEKQATPQPVVTQQSPAVQVPETAQSTQPQATMPAVDGPSYDDLPQYDEPDYDEGPVGYDAPPMGNTGGATQQPRSVQPAAQPQVQPQSQPKADSAPPRSSSIGGLRHQLRSRRAGGAQTTSPSSSAPASRGKKSSAASASSVLERVAQQHGTARVMPQQAMQPGVQTPQEDPNEPYQWKPTSAPVEVVDDTLTPAQIKQALEHTKTPEMAEKLLAESVAQDKWTALIQKLEIAKMVEQLALNSAFSKQGSTIALSLRASHAHLNSDRAQQELLGALNQVLGEQCHLTVEIGDQGQTPLELRESLYQGKLQAAHTALAGDPNVAFIQTRFAAELDKDSVRPI